MVEEHNVQPVLVGSQLHELSGKTYIILYLYDAIRLPAESWTLFRECLRNHTVLPNADIVLTSGITLNVQSVQ